MPDLRPRRGRPTTEGIKAPQSDTPTGVAGRHALGGERPTRCQAEAVTRKSHPMIVNPATDRRTAGGGHGLSAFPNQVPDDDATPIGTQLEHALAVIEKRRQEEGIEDPAPASASPNRVPPRRSKTKAEDVDTPVFRPDGVTPKAWSLQVRSEFDRNTKALPGKRPAVTNTQFRIWCYLHSEMYHEERRTMTIERTYEWIAQDIGMSVSSVEKGLKCLRAIGFVRKIKEGHKRQGGTLWQLIGTPPGVSR